MPLKQNHKEVTGVRELMLLARKPLPPGLSRPPHERRASWVFYRYSRQQHTGHPKRKLRAFLEPHYRGDRSLDVPMFDHHSHQEFRVKKNLTRLSTLAGSAATRSGDIAAAAKRANSVSP